MFEKLFTPIRIRDLELRNRVVMSAMGTHEAAESASQKDVTDKLIAFHAARARGGCGLNTVEVSSVDEASAPKGFLSIALDDYVPGFRRLNDAVHAAGGKTCLQLWQGGLAVASDRTAEILLPDAMPLSPQYTVPAITEERLYAVIDAYGKAAKRAVDAGFDCLEFHCAHNYLPHSMLSGGLNHRTDGWGGSFENRMKFPLACIKAIRDQMPEGMPLFMRIGCHDDMLPGGLTVDDVIAFCKEAGKAGVDVLNISRGNIMTAATMYEVAPVDIPNGFNVEDAARIRQETGMLTMPCGRINTPELAESVLQADQADLIVMARAQLADADFCNKAREGKLNDIRYCIGCNQGCYDSFTRALADPSVKHIACTRNPALLEEETLSLKPGARAKKVLIAGGGVAGLEAAIDLKKTGNEPVLFEASDSLGGQFLLGGAAPGKADFYRAGEKMIRNVYELGIAVHKNTALTEETLLAEKPDAVILATGSEPVTLPIPGAEQAVQAHDILGGAKADAKKAVVIGGGLVGFECAELLASKGTEVTVLEMKEQLFTDLGSLRQIAAQFALKRLPITMITQAEVKRIEEHQVIAEKDGAEVSFEADLAVMAAGSTARDTAGLREACEKAGIPVYVTGDAKKAPGLAITAIHDAYHAVLDLCR